MKDAQNQGFERHNKYHIRKYRLSESIQQEINRYFYYSY